MGVKKLLKGMYDHLVTFEIMKAKHDKKVEDYYELYSY